jgi:hypothetical protein
MADATLDLRPRSTGEVLDDAWRLALRDAPLLLLFSSLFQVPAFILFLMLMTQPSASGTRALLPASVALVLLLTGIGSGACQELFRRRLEEQPVGPLACLWGGARNGLRHTAARGLVLAVALPALGLLVVPDLVILGALVAPWPALLVWATAPILHPLIASRRGHLFLEFRREAAAGVGKAAGVVLVRIPLLVIAVINLHLLLLICLWIGENFIGIYTALLAAPLLLFGNPVYTLGLFLLAWLLLSPFFEAANLLLHLDARTRQEGLDLFYRVRRVFPTTEAAAATRTAGAVALACAYFLSGGNLSAAAPTLDTIRGVRIGVGKVQQEIKAADPYPGSGHWERRLRNLASRLERAEPEPVGNPRWFSESLDGFGMLPRATALQVVGDIHQRLLSLEDALAVPHRQPPDSGAEATPERVRSLLRGRAAPRPRPPDAAPQTKKDERKRTEHMVQADGEPSEGGRRTGGTAIAGPVLEGLGAIGWGLLVGLIVAVVALVVWQVILWRREGPRQPKPAPATITRRDEEPLPRPDERSAAELWRRAEVAARDGNFRQALRWLYLAVLFLLDSRQVLHFEPTRTNGEYLRQLRQSEQAPEALRRPFKDLTNRFDVSWYGEAPLGEVEYRELYRLAEAVRESVA